MRMSERIGIFPGTFNPMHEGHISFALAAIKECGLNKVIFLPEQFPPNKIDTPDVAERVLFAQNLVLQHPELDVRGLQRPLTTESEADELKDIFERSIVVLLMGSDTLKHLPNWKDVKTVLTSHEICVGLRGEDTEAETRMILENLAIRVGVPITAYVLASPHGHISSTGIRNTTV